MGAPGSGKTTLLRHSARRVFASKHRNVPILLYLRDHVAEIARNPDVSVATLTANTLGDLGKTEPSGWFTQKLTDGACVVLLDGLDEVARKQDRQLVADWVGKQINHFPRNDFVLTSRPHGYRATPVNGATVLRVQSFTDEQVRAFVRGWYVAIERHINPDAPVHKAEAEAEDLLGRLHDAPALTDLTVNPLLLTMIANVHKYRKALPGSRVELYSEICQVMLWRRQEVKKLPLDISGDKKATLLAALAYTMMQDRVRDLSGKRLHEEVGSTLRRLSRKVTAADFVADVTSNGLLVERESGLYAFAHHTFQEFLAANHIRDKNLLGTLVDNVDDLWWRETTLLYTARADADAIVEACLKSGSVQALSLALDCVDQGSELKPELSDELDSLVTDALATTADRDHRALAARVLVTRHLRQLTSVEGHGQVCTAPITRKIYHLFRQEVPGPMPDAPDEFVPDDTPVLGARRADALSFVKWVNGITEGSYRLPTSAELNDPRVRRKIGSVRSAWLNPDQASYALWAGYAAVHPHYVGATIQVGQLAADLKRHGAPTLLKDSECLENLENRSMGERAFAGLSNVVVDLDKLPIIIREVRTEVEHMTNSPWARTVGRGFAEAALPVFERQQTLTAELASALRIAAWCLVPVAKDHGLTVTADQLLHCTAGLILMERRANGDAPIAETILLAAT
nr:NACHT domain-containing protein [Kibdelosporangium phytohabitans]